MMLMACVKQKKLGLAQVSSTTVKELGQPQFSAKEKSIVHELACWHATLRFSRGSIYHGLNSNYDFCQLTVSILFGGGGRSLLQKAGSEFNFKLEKSSPACAKSREVRKIFKHHETQG